MKQRFLVLYLFLGLFLFHHTAAKGSPFASDEENARWTHHTNVLLRDITILGATAGLGTTYCAWKNLQQRGAIFTGPASKFATRGGLVLFAGAVAWDAVRRVATISYIQGRINERKIWITGRPGTSVDIHRRSTKNSSNVNEG